VVHGFDNPIKKDSPPGDSVRNLAPTGAVAKISGKEGLTFSGRARVFESRKKTALAAILDGTVKKGDVVVIRYEGPKRRSGNA